MGMKGDSPMRLLIISIIAIVNLFTSVLFGDIFTTETNNIIRVPTDYTNLQEAVDHSSPGDTIFIAPGTYDQVVIIRHSLQVLGAKASDVIVGGTSENSGIYIRSDNVRLSNLTSRNVLDPLNSSKVTIDYCIINHEVALFGYDCSIENCIVFIDPEPLLVPGRSEATSAGLTVGTNGHMRNNLILGIQGQDAGHFEGTPPPYVTPRPTAPFGGPYPGWASTQTGISCGAGVKMVSNTVVNVRGGDTGYLTYDDLLLWSVIYPGNGKGLGIQPGEGTYVANNLIWNIRGGEPLFPTAYGTWVSPGYSIGINIVCLQPTQGFTVENNMIWDADYGIALDVRCGTAGYKIRNNYWAHPGFVNPASGDYHLLPNSPAIDAGTPITWLLSDAEGNPRPSNFGWDIGAFEYQNLLSDINHDGVVNALDLNEFVKQWGLELPKIKPSGKVLIQSIDLLNNSAMPTPRLPRTPYPTPNPQMFPVTPTPCSCPSANTPTHSP